MPEQTIQTMTRTLLTAGVVAIFSGQALAQHAGDIGLRSSDGQLEVYGPIGSDEDTGGVFLGTFGDTGFSGYTPNPRIRRLPRYVLTGKNWIQRTDWSHAMGSDDIILA